MNKDLLKAEDIVLPKELLPAIHVSDLLPRLEKIVREEFYASPQPDDIHHLVINYMPIDGVPKKDGKTKKDEEEYQKKLLKRNKRLKEMALTTMTSKRNYIKAALDQNEMILTFPVFAEKYVFLAEKFRKKFGYEMNFFEFTRAYNREIFNRYEIPSEKEKKLEIMECAYNRLCKEPNGLSTIKRKRSIISFPHRMMGLIRQ